MNQEIIKTSSELYEEATEAAMLLNEAILADSHSAIKKQRKAATEAVDAANKAYRDEAYAVLLANENPFLAAITTGYIECLKLKISVDKDTKIERADIETGEDVINLVDLETSCKDRKLAHNGQWVYWAEKFAFVMAARVNSDIGGDAAKFKKLYKMDDVSRNCDIGATPTSNMQMLKQLQTIIDGILFQDNGEGLNIYKALTKDVHYIKSVMTKRGKERLSVSMPTRKTVIKMVTEVLYRIVNDGSYTSEYEMVK